ATAPATTAVAAAAPASLMIVNGVTLSAARQRSMTRRGRVVTATLGERMAREMGRHYPVFAPAAQFAGGSRAAPAGAAGGGGGGTEEGRRGGGPWGGCGFGPAGGGGFEGENGG